MVLGGWWYPTWDTAPVLPLGFPMCSLEAEHASFYRSPLCLSGRPDLLSHGSLRDPDLKKHLESWLRQADENTPLLWSRAAVTLWGSPL